MVHPVQAFDLPEASNLYIAQMLAEIFHSHHQISLTDSPEDWAGLERDAHKIREQLTYEPQAVVHLEHIANQYSLQTILPRQALLAWHQMMAEKPLYEEIPRYCPACQQILAGHWDCAFCGLELENQERHAWNYQASVLPSTHLPLGLAVIADPVRQRLLILDCKQPVTVLWEIAAPHLKAKEPVDALFLPGAHLLVTDRVGNRVFECGLFGNEYWSYDSQNADQIPLNRPVKATLYHHQGKEHILIVDQGNHRVLAVDREHQVIWQYGHTGQARSEDGYLDHPLDACLTHDGLIMIADSGNNRILVINPVDNHVVWHSPVFISLEKPVAVQELYNHHLLVVDSGNFRILELSRDSEIEVECVYFTPDMARQFKIDLPTRLVRLANQHVILQDETRLLEIQFLQQHLIQKQLLAELQCDFRSNIALSLEATPEDIAHLERHLRQARGEFILDDVLRQVKVFAHAPNAFFEHLTHYLVAQDMAPGDILIQQGEMGDAMYLIEKGEVDVVKEPDQVIAVLEQGDIFGEMSLLLQEPRNATVRARKAGTVLRLTKLAFEAAIQPFPEVYEALKDLVEARQSVASLKKTTEAMVPGDTLTEVLARQQHKLDEIRQQFNTQPRRSPLLVQSHPAWRLLYRTSEQNLIHQASRKHYQCFELHIYLHPGYEFKSARMVLIVTVLERLGTLVKTFPPPEAVEKGEVGQTFAVTLLTQLSKEQVLEDVTSIADVDKVDIFTIWF